MRIVLIHHGFLGYLWILAMFLAVLGGCDDNRLKIDIWYGDSQSFGSPGNPQRAINILGNISRTSSKKSYSFFFASFKIFFKVFSISSYIYIKYNDLFYRRLVFFYNHCILNRIHTANTRTICTAFMFVSRAITLYKSYSFWFF